MTTPHKIQIELKLFVTLAKYHPTPGETIEIESGCTVAELIHAFKIPEKEVHLIFINGARALAQTVVQAGDRVGLFPAIGGG